METTKKINIKKHNYSKSSHIEDDKNKNIKSLTNSNHTNTRNNRIIDKPFQKFNGKEQSPIDASSSFKDSLNSSQHGKVMSENSFFKRSGNFNYGNNIPSNNYPTPTFKTHDTLVNKIQDFSKLIEDEVYEDYRYNDYTARGGDRERSGTLIINSATSFIETTKTKHRISLLKGVQKIKKLNETIKSSSKSKKKIIEKNEISIGRAIFMLSKRNSNPDDLLLTRNQRYDKGGVVDLTQSSIKTNYKYQVKKLDSKSQQTILTNNIKTAKTQRQKAYAIVVIQNWWRSTLKKFSIFNKKIIKIQSTWKGFILRQTLKDIDVAKKTIGLLCNKINKGYNNYLDKTCFTELKQQYAKLYYHNKYLKKVKVIQRATKHFLNQLRNPLFNGVNKLRKIFDLKRKLIFDFVHDYDKVKSLRNNELRNLFFSDNQLLYAKKDTKDESDFEIENIFITLKSKNQIDPIGISKLLSYINDKYLTEPFNKMNNYRNLNKPSKIIYKSYLNHKNKLLKTYFEYWFNLNLIISSNNKILNQNKKALNVFSFKLLFKIKLLSKAFSRWKFNIIKESLINEKSLLLKKFNTFNSSNTIFDFIYKGSIKYLNKYHSANILNKILSKAKSDSITSLINPNSKLRSKARKPKLFNIFDIISLRHYMKIWKYKKDHDIDLTNKLKILINKKIDLTKNLRKYNLSKSFSKWNKTVLKIDNHNLNNSNISKNNLLASTNLLNKTNGIMKKIFEKDFFNKLINTKTNKQEKRRILLKNIPLLTNAFLNNHNNMIVNIYHFNKWKMNSKAINKLTTKLSDFSSKLNSLMKQKQNSKKKYIFDKIATKSALIKYNTQTNKKVTNLANCLSDKMKTNTPLTSMFMNNLKNYNNKKGFKIKQTTSKMLNTILNNTKNKKRYYYNKWRLNSIKLGSIIKLKELRLRQSIAKLQKNKIEYYFFLWKKYITKEILFMKNIQFSILLISRLNKEKLYKHKSLFFNSLISKERKITDKTSKLIRLLNNRRIFNLKLSFDKINQKTKNNNELSIKCIIIKNITKRMIKSLLNNCFKYWKNQYVIEKTKENESKIRIEEEDKFNEEIKKIKLNSKKRSIKLLEEAIPKKLDLNKVDDLFLKHLCSIHLKNNVKAENKNNKSIPTEDGDEELLVSSNKPIVVSKIPTNQINKIGLKTNTNNQIIKQENELNLPLIKAPELNKLLIKTPELKLSSNIKLKAQENSLKNSLKIKNQLLKHYIISPFLNRWKEQSIKIALKEKESYLKYKLFGRLTNKILLKPERNMKKNKFILWKYLLSTETIKDIIKNKKNIEFNSNESYLVNRLETILKKSPFDKIKSHSIFNQFYKIMHPIIKYKLKSSLMKYYNPITFKKFKNKTRIKTFLSILKIQSAVRKCITCKKIKKYSKIHKVLESIDNNNQIDNLHRLKLSLNKWKIDVINDKIANSCIKIQSFYKMLKIERKFRQFKHNEKVRLFANSLLIRKLNLILVECNKIIWSKMKILFNDKESISNNSINKFPLINTLITFYSNLNKNHLIKKIIENQILKENKSKQAFLNKFLNNKKSCSQSNIISKINLFFKNDKEYFLIKLKNSLPDFKKALAFKMLMEISCSSIKFIKDCNTQKIIKRWRFYVFMKRMSKKKLNSLYTNIQQNIKLSANSIINDSSNDMRSLMNKIEEVKRKLNKEEKLRKRVFDPSKDHILFKKGFKGFKDIKENIYNAYDSDKEIK